MYCNEKKFTGTLPSYALYCSHSDAAFIWVSVWLKHKNWTYFVRNFLDVLLIVCLREVILDPADPEYVSVCAYERCTLTGG